jgi:hypothetical protein
VAVAAIVSGCAGVTTSGPVTPSASPLPTVGHTPLSPLPEISQGQGYAETKDGHFLLSLDLPKRIWRTDEAITGTATLYLIGQREASLGGSGEGVIAYAYEQLDGDKRAECLPTSDLVFHGIAADAPITTDLFKCASYQADAPPTDFNRQFAEDPQIQLPPGIWKVTATARFLENGDPDTAYDIETAVVLKIVP